MSVKTRRWINKKESYTAALVYMKGRKDGVIKSFRTPWPKFNDATVDGIEWHSTTILAGRSGSGKTLIKDMIVREGFKLNPGQDFRILEFSFEMRGLTTALRTYSSLTGLTYKDLCSGVIPVDQTILDTCDKYAQEANKYPVDVVETPCTVQEFVEIIMEYMEDHSYLDNSPQKVKRYRNTVITLDHSILLKRAAHEQTFDMLYNFGEALTALKRKYPIAFIILSQLNRSVDTAPGRRENGNSGNYILDSDLFGADSLLQHADLLIGINRPANQDIQFYGAKRFIIEDKNTLAVHFLKCRNGEPGLAWFRAEYHNMKISEMNTPAQQHIKTRS